MEVKYHTLIKHKILEEYLKSCDIAFRKKDGSKGDYGDFVFIETHSGDGEAHVKEHNRTFDGSATIAAKIQPKFPCIFIENDPGCIEKLNKNLKSYDNATILPGDCNEKIKDALLKLSKNSIAVVFVDPKNYKEVCWNTISEIKNRSRTDLILNFPLGIIRREIEIEGAWDGIAEFFGTKDWIKYKDDFVELVKFYLKRLGYRYTHIHLVTSVEKNAPLYLVVLGTNHPLGNSIGGWVWSKTIRKWVETEFPKIVYQVKSINDFTNKDLKSK